MKRRIVLAAAGCALAARAQVGGQRPFRIGFLTQNTREAGGNIILETFIRQMRLRGFEQGRDYVIEPRFGNRDADLIAAGARELVALNPDVVLAGASVTVVALLQLTRTIPIVGVAMTTPVEAGLAQSYARPGGNLTGCTFNQPEFAGKMVDFLKIVAPRIAHVAVIRNPTFPGMSHHTPYAERAAAQLGVTLHYVEVPKAGALRMAELERMSPDALLVAHEYAVFSHYPELVPFAMARKLPSIGTSIEFTRAGGLLSLFADNEQQFVIAADYVTRILSKTATPATLPIQEPTKHWLVLNRRTADAIKVTLSHELLLRVNETIT
ncbi:MAG: ABC transporter substrate-binding protein [Burkholderiales bacterium]|nr:ABC transporter substrate-binding protein [Burkholderiales bacterium]